MELNSYQKKALSTCLNNPEETIQMLRIRLAFGIAGEAGEIAEKFKKVLRDKQAVFAPEDKEAIAKELGDVLWYIAVLAEKMGFDLADIAAMNIAKLADRQARGAIGGSGDER